MVNSEGSDGMGPKERVKGLRPLLIINSFHSTLRSPESRSLCHDQLTVHTTFIWEKPVCEVRIYGASRSKRRIRSGT